MTTKKKQERCDNAACKKNITEQRVLYTNEAGALNNERYCSAKCAEARLVEWARNSEGAQVPPGCTGYFHAPSASLQHDDKTCPVHERLSVADVLRAKFKDDRTGVDVSVRTSASDYLTIENVRPHDIDVEDNLLGVATIAGSHFHVELLSVVDGDDPLGVQTATRDPYNRLDSLSDDVEPDGGFQTVTLDGFPGEWVLHIYPMSA